MNLVISIDVVHEDGLILESLVYHIEWRAVFGPKYKVFNLLSKITESYLVKNASKVLSKQISLKCLAEEYQVEMNVEKVYSVLCRMTGFKSKNQLHVDYPGMFTSDIMRKYVGAEIDGKFIKLVN